MNDQRGKTDEPGVAVERQVMPHGYGPFYIDTDFVEHKCCWRSAIVRRCGYGDGAYGQDVALILECDSGDAEWICAALNAALPPAA